MSNKFRSPLTRMHAVSQIILIASNLVIAAAVSFHVLKPAPTPPVAPAAIPVPAPLKIEAVLANPPVVIDLQPLLKPIQSVEQSINHLSVTIQRFNTTTLQYEYLHQEIERFVRLDQSLAQRITQEQSIKRDLRTAETEKTIKELKRLQDQVQLEMKRRRDTTTTLIEGLERELISTMSPKKAASNIILKGSAASSQKPVENVTVPNPPASTAPAK